MSQLPIYNPKWDIIYLQDEINKLSLRVMALEEAIEERKTERREKEIKGIGKTDNTNQERAETESQKKCRMGRAKKPIGEELPDRPNQ